jgi:hypothetical protein
MSAYMPLVAAYDMTHSTGQVHVASTRLGLIELAIALIMIALFLYGLLKSNKSKK